MGKYDSAAQAASAGYLHFYDARTRRLSCGFIGTSRVGWTVKRADVDCPECLRLLNPVAEVASRTVSAGESQAAEA